MSDNAVALGAIIALCVALIGLFLLIAWTKDRL